MRIIARSRLKEWQAGYAEAAAALEAWYAAVRKADWKAPNEVTTEYPRARTIPKGRAVFKIKGNDYRLIVAVNYSTGCVYLRWFGPHSDYDDIDASEV
ncbi:MAG: type II toxin-antitoxin system HigB family toxin [Armatimonadetes bacterium]|nr:type II toxin-antitoxin system HigB family toxin [Armatimonadota bacterium]